MSNHTSVHTNDALPSLHYKDIQMTPNHGEIEVEASQATESKQIETGFWPDRREVNQVQSK